MAGISPEVNIGASTAAAQLKIGALKALLSDLAKKIYTARLATDDAKFQSQLARDYAQLLKLDKTIASPKIDLLGVSVAEAQMLSIAAGLERINKVIAVAHISVDDADAERRLALLLVQLSALAGRVVELRVGADTGQLRALDDLLSRIGVLTERVNTLDFNVVGLPEVEAAEKAFQALDTQVGSAMPQAIARAQAGWTGFFNFLRRRPLLFGGLLGTGLIGSIGVWHILADAIIEVGAVLIPAGIALGAFAAAAGDAAGKVISHFRSVQTVMSATDQAVRPFSDAFGRLQDAITPRVYEIFGQVMTVINGKMGVFAKLAMGAAGVMDQLAARSERAIASSGFQKFLSNAITDLSKVGNIIGDVFGIIGNLLKFMSFWAQALLNAVGGVTRALEVFTGLPVVQALGRFVVGFHGLWLWVGLLATALLGIIPWFARISGSMSVMTAKAGESGSRIAYLKGSVRDLGANFPILGTRISNVIPGIKAWASRMVEAGGAAATAGKGSKLLAFALGSVKSIGWGWVGIGVIALGALAFYLATAKTRTDQWISSLQAAVDKSATWANVVGDVTGQLAKTNQALAASVVQTAKVTQGTNQIGDGFRHVSDAAISAIQSQNALRGSQQNLTAEFGRTGFRLGEMARRFGGYTEAMGLARLAGIKVTDLLHANTQAFAQDLQQIEGLVQGYKFMGIQSGALGNAVKALQFTADDQIQAVNQLNQAWTTFLGIVSGGEGTFVSFAQDMLSANKALAQTGGTPRTVTATFNAAQTGAQRAASAASRAHEAFSGLNAQSLQLRSTWLTSIQAAQSYYEALQTQSAAASDGAKGSALLARAGADLIRILAPAAKGSNVMKQAIFALAQQFGISAGQMQKLIDHGGSLKKNEQDLQKVNDALAKSVSNVSKDWAAMATTLNSQVKSALDAVALKSSGAAYAAKKLYEALHQQGPVSQAAHDWYNRLVQDLHNSGLSWKAATDYANAYTKGLGFNFSAVRAGRTAVQNMITDTTRQKQLFQDIKPIIDRYTGSIGKNSSTASSGNAARARLITDIEAAGNKAHLTSSQIDTLIARILRLNRTQLRLLMSGRGNFTIQQVVSLSQPGGKLAGPLGAAAGGMIHGGTPGRDSVLAALMPGEVVVPTHMVRGGAVDHLRGHLPGFASGGAVSGSLPAVAQWMAGVPGKFQQDMISALETAMSAALRSAVRAAQAAVSGVAGPGGGAPGANAALAERLYASVLTPAMWAAWNDVAMHESGWNQFARNPTSGAYGIPQALPESKLPFAGQAVGGSNPTAQITWMWNYMQQRYGGPLGAEAHELAFGWYDRGGYLPPGLSMAWNGTGRGERVSAPGEPIVIRLEVASGGGAEFEQFMVTAFRRWVRVRGGNVQTVFGRK